MYCFCRNILLRETDATGILYYSSLLELVTEGVERYFLSRGISLKRMIEEEEYTLPIVHVEADYFLPLFVGDEVEVQIELDHVGTSSFTLKGAVLKGGAQAGSVKIVHVAVSNQSKKSLPIPEELLAQFCEL